MGAWKTSWQRKHSDWALEKENRVQCRDELLYRIQCPHIILSKTSPMAHEDTRGAGKCHSSLAGQPLSDSSVLLKGGTNFWRTVHLSSLPLFPHL